MGDKKEDDAIDKAIIPSVGYICKLHFLNQGSSLLMTVQCLRGRVGCAHNELLPR